MAVLWFSPPGEILRKAGMPEAPRGALPIREQEGFILRFLGGVFKQFVKNSNLSATVVPFIYGFG